MTYEEMEEKRKLNSAFEKIKYGTLKVYNLTEEEKQLLCKHFNQKVQPLVSHNYEQRQEWEKALYSTIYSENRIDILALKTAVEISVGETKNLTPTQYYLEAQEKYFKNDSPEILEMFDDESYKKLKISKSELKQDMENLYYNSIYLFFTTTNKMLYLINGQNEAFLPKEK